MKRLFTMLLLTAICSASALAQKGMNGFGVNVPLSIGQGTTALGIGVKYYYNISDYVRLEPSAEFLPIHSGGNKVYDFPLFKGFLNAHLFLMSPRPSRPYIMAGVGYVFYDQNVEVEESIAAYNPYTGATYSSGPTSYSYNGYNDDGFCYNVGVGYDFRLSHSFSMQVEATGMSCFSCSNHSSQSSYDISHQGKWVFLARVGCTYNF